MRSINTLLLVLTVLIFSCNTTTENESKSAAGADTTVKASAQAATPTTSAIDSSTNKTAELIKNKLQKKYKNDLSKNVIDSFSRRFQFAEFDLNDDGGKEIFVAYTGTYFCGSGGCSFDILNEKGEWVSHFTVSDFPVLVEKTKSNGWYNLVVRSGGKNHLLKFDGKKYPSNPGIAPVYKGGDTAALTQVLTHTQDASAWISY